MRFTQFLSSVAVISFAVLLFANCKSSKEVQEIKSTDTKPEVVVETSAAIVGSLEALQRELNYPQEAKNKGIETTLIAKVLVNKNGKVEQISFEKEMGYGFEDAAREALHAVTFKAGERNGKSVNMFITIPVKFEL